MDVLNILLYAHVWMAKWAFRLTLGMLFLAYSVVLGIWHLFFPRKGYLPTGEKIITYADGVRKIELKHKDGPTRLVPDTDQKRREIAEMHNRKSLRRFLRRKKTP